MNYFTPDLLVRLQVRDPAAMNDADAEWEAAEQRYEQRLQELGPAIDPLLRRFEDVLLHDATVWSISRHDDHFVIILRKDIPPRDVVILTYMLVAEPILVRDALPPQFRSQVMQFQYDEFDVEQEAGQSHFTHRILFSNGWEIRLAFRDLQVTLAQPIYPLTAPSFAGEAQSV
jgi:hypothetical protein